jgi:hypothetical protein
VLRAARTGAHGAVRGEAAPDRAGAVAEVVDAGVGVVAGAGEARGQAVRVLCAGHRLISVR